MTTRRKLGAAFLRILGVICAVGIPASEVLKRFPIWRDGEAKPIDGKSLGIGGVMLLIIALLALREKVWSTLKAKLHINYIGLIIFGGLGFTVLLTIERYLVPILPDLRCVFLAVLVGALAGMILDAIAGLISPKGG